MKREIRFRAWDEWNKRMCGMSSGRAFNSTEVLQGIDGNGKFDPVKGMILMQCTGLHDKNGKDIYEGDLVRWETDFLGEPQTSEGWVVWHEKYARFNVAWRTDRLEKIYGTHRFMHSRDDESDLEVIGNIYENPELLEG